MTRVSLTESYDDRSVIAKLNKMADKVAENTSVVHSAEESARQSAQSAQETADRFAGSVGAVVQNANAQINASKVLVNEAKSEVDATVTTVAQAVQTANNASASAQASAQTVAGYGDRLQRAETDIQTLDGETEDLYRKDGENVKIGTPQYITGAKTFVVARTKNSLETKVDVPPQQRQTQPVQVIDRNDEQVMFNQLLTNTNGTRQYRTNLFSTNGTRMTIENIFLNADGTGYSTCVNPSAGAPSSAVVNKAYVEATNPATKLNNLVHDVDNEDIHGIKRHLEGIYGVSQCLNIASPQTNRWIGIAYKGNTTQFCKFDFCNYINSGTSVYIEGVMFWNGGSQGVFVKAYGYTTGLSGRMKWTVDSDNNFTVWMRGEPYHSVMANVYQSRSWTNTMIPEIVIIDNPDFSSYAKSGDVVIQ